MKIVVIDGQGGRIGALIIERLKAKLSSGNTIVAVGTNSSATTAMMKAGAEHGATGENPVVVNAADADIIIGTMGIIMADSLLGEITPAMAKAVGQSHAQRILIPMTRCHTFIAGTRNLSIAEYVDEAVEKAAALSLCEGDSL